MKLGSFRLPPAPDAGDAGPPTPRYRRDRTVPEIFAEVARATPDAVAVIDGGRETSYRALGARADALASWLAGRHFEPESPVAIAMPRSADAVAAMLGILKAGCAYLPIAEDWPLPRARAILADSGARALVGTAGRLDALRAWRGDGDLPIVVADAGRAALTEGEHGWPTSDAGVGAGSADRSRPGGLAYVMYTSGTTGVPKGVMIEHRAILRLVVDPDYLRLGPSDRITLTGALSFDAATFEVWGALLNGGAVCVPGPDELLDLAALERLVARHGVTTMFLTTGLFNAAASHRPGLFATLRTLITGGERMSPRHAERVRRRCPSLAIINAYGPTENTTFTTCFDVRGPLDGEVPIGRPIARSRVVLLDGAMREVPDGEVGEICAGGDGLARGYLNDPALTAERFVPDPAAPGERLYRTGDLGRRRPDGVLEFLGRADDQIKLHGHRIEPAEVELRLARVPGLREVAVTASGSDAERRVLVAFYTADAPLAPDALRRAVAAELPDVMVPARFVQLPRLPLTVNGKVDRRALPALDGLAPPFAAPDDPVPDGDGPQGETEEILLSVWREVLGRPDAAPDDDFFDLGGYSLLTVRLAHLVEARVGAAVPYTLIYEAPTVRTLAARIVEAARSGRAEIDRPLARLSSGSRALYAFPPGTSDALSYADLAARLGGWSVRAFNFTPASSDPAAFADLMLAEDPTRPSVPFTLFGYSGGGNWAFRTAVELERRGLAVAAVVMLDASRFLARFAFPAGEARRMAQNFLGAEAVRAQLPTAPVRDRIAARIDHYYDALPRIPDEGVLRAPLHLIAGEGTGEDYRADDGRLICSRLAWAASSRGGFTRHRGHGPHERMLLAPHLDANARLIRTVLDAIPGPGPGVRTSSWE